MSLQDTNTLFEGMKGTIARTVHNNKIGIAFSGGVDSTLLSKMCMDMGYDVTLLTVGFSGSHDTLFARQVNEQMRLPHHVLEIDPETFPQTLARIRDIVKTDNLSWIENCTAFYYVSGLARKYELDFVVTANGIDELFCGYNAYTKAIEYGERRVMDVMASKIDNELKMMKAVGLVASEYGVTFLQPLLSPEFIALAKSVPISEKIRGPDDMYRKHAIRAIARAAGVPEISCAKKKKALQYGSRIHKRVLKAKKLSLQRS